MQISLLYEDLPPESLEVIKGASSCSSSLLVSSLLLCRLLFAAMRLSGALVRDIPDRLSRFLEGERTALTAADGSFSDSSLALTVEKKIRKKT